jgi:16S rRNA (guanine527-N7)-methyltransferase
MRMERPQDFTEGLDVSRETSERLERYADLVKRWNPKINLVSRASLDQLWTRHIIDSAQLFALRPTDARHWADLGSGGGFPGLVIAALAAEAAPDLRVTLVESDSRKAAFLATAARELGLTVTVKPERIEALAPLGADVLSARALAPLDTLLGYASRHLAPAGRALFPKGARAEEEIAAARKHWAFDLHRHPSKTAADGAILEIGAIAHA